MDEILWELRDHSGGLNCGRWDYIYSFIKKFAEDPACVMPDRAQVTMTSHFLRSYSLLLIKTCHRREIHAMGGMAAQIPIRDDPVSNEAAMEKVRADKEREVGDRHDGTWVAHPGLVAIAKEVFDREIRHRARLEDGRIIDACLCRALLGEELEKLRQSAAEGGRCDDAAKLFRELIEAPTFPEFLTLPAYEMITANIT